MAEDNWQSLLRATIPIASQRKNTLYFCAGLRHLWDWIIFPISRFNVELSERVADGVAINDEATEYLASFIARWRSPSWIERMSVGCGIENQSQTQNEVEAEEIYGLYLQTLVRLRYLPVRLMSENSTLSNEETHTRLSCIADSAEQALFFVKKWTTNQGLLNSVLQVPNWPGTWLIREIHGDGTPRPQINPEWLEWDSGTVRGIAEVIYEERVFGRLPILADALQEAGCDDQAVLRHLREPGEHHLGCWALDWVLGKS